MLQCGKIHGRYQPIKPRQRKPRRQIGIIGLNMDYAARPSHRQARKAGRNHLPAQDLKQQRNGLAVMRRKPVDGYTTALASIGPHRRRDRSKSHDSSPNKLTLANALSHHQLTTKAC